MITAFLIGALALVIGFIMGANAAKSKIMHDIEMGFLDEVDELIEVYQREIRAQKQEQRDYRSNRSNGSNGRTVDGTFHHME